jgi:hypothetical protein
MDKKADFTIEEFLKIVIAVVAIIILVLLAVKLYDTFSQRTEEEQAKIHLENIKNLINGLDEGDQKNYLIESPGDWYFLFYDKPFNFFDKPAKYLVATYSIIPNENCEENCICICPALESSWGVDLQNKDYSFQCDQGICSNVENYNLKEEDKNYGLHKIPVDILFKENNGFIEVS